MVDPKPPPARVVWLFAEEDESLARELLRFSAVLARLGLIENWSPLDLLPGQAWDLALFEWVLRADVIMVLVSPDLVAEESRRVKVSLAAVAQARGVRRIRVVPVLLRASLLPDELSSLQVLPRDGKPIAGRRDRDEAFLEVIQGLQEVVAFRPNDSGRGGASLPRVTQEGARGLSGALRESLEPLTMQARPLNVNAIFRLDGPPSVTFVEPPQFPLLKLELGTMGTGLIVEGPSKIGKSTAIKRAMAALGVSEGQQIWWEGQAPPSLDEFRRTLDELLRAKQNTWLFIDDFHYLEDEGYRRTLAFRMKALADRDERHAKVTLIGINPLGGSLVQVMPDLAGRFRILRIDREKDWAGSTKIAELIVRGEQALNARFSRRDEFVVAAGGSFFIAQLLCNRAAARAGVFEPPPRTATIDLGPADVVSAIGTELAARYRAPLLDLAAYDESPPPRGAGLSLLWLLARSDDGFVALKEARLRFPMLRPAFDWLLGSNLTRCFREHPSLKGLLYFNRAAATLTMEDPQLKFYLRQLDWEEFAEASGHGHVSFHPQDGPIWPPTPQPPGVSPGAGRPGATDVAAARASAANGGGASRGAPAAHAEGGRAAKARRVLHLSDLHFATADQATVAYAQLAADLRQQGVERLDALLASGDLVNRATPSEYDAARLFLEQLMSGFSLAPRRIVLVPGNHDVSWTLSEAAYSLHKRSRYGGELKEGAFIEHGPDIVEVRDEEAYRRRFQPFADFYRQITGDEYPLDYNEQGLFADLSDAGLVVLGLNSAWQIDHHYRDRASIHMGALSRALLKLGPPDDRLRVAMFHHPLSGGEDSRIRDDSFLQQLAVHGFRLVVHGHVHKADAGLYRYDRSAGGRRLDIITAGTFGAPVREWVPGYPLQYNLLLVDEQRVTVETRCRREVNGAWEPDAIWRQGPGQDPLPRYHVER
ncbi:MAG TPA: metallophosphoesterase [Polyangiaceae bacterium]|nr:metallophosphoesterase [Polyangiaceae bacterium]